MAENIVITAGGKSFEGELNDSVTGRAFQLIIDYLLLIIGIEK